MRVKTCCIAGLLPMMLANSVFAPQLLAQIDVFRDQPAFLHRLGDD